MSWKPTFPDGLGGELQRLADFLTVEVRQFGYDPSTGMCSPARTGRRPSEPG
jgi:hypothetical protein